MIVSSKNVQIEIIYSNISSSVNIPIISNTLNPNVTVIISAAANIIITFIIRKANNGTKQILPNFFDFLDNTAF